MISAIIPAAGRSIRMGRPKMLLPWGGGTVLGTVIQTLKSAGTDDILVVTGSSQAGVEEIAQSLGARTVPNPMYETDEMLSSVQVGLRALSSSAEAALITLGDQPQIRESTVRQLLEEYRRESSMLIVPSFNMRRGHPWLVARKLWQAILELCSPHTLRDFLRLHSDEIRYIEVETPTILQDLDTPEDYLKSKR